MTQREFFNAVVNGGSYTYENRSVETVTVNIFNEDGTFTDSAIEFAKERIAALDRANENRKNGTSQTALATAAKRQEIFDGMEFDRTYTAKEIADIFGLGSTQKATGLLSKIDGLTVADFSPTGKKKDTVKGYTKPSAQ
jgi:hypothetical protein